MTEFKKKDRTFLIKFFGWMMNQPFFACIIRFLAKHGWLHQPRGFNKYLMQKWGTCGITAFALPNRARGVPPLNKGHNADIAFDFDKAERCYFRAMGWDPGTGIPLQETLQALGLKEVEAVLYGGAD